MEKEAILQTCRDYISGNIRLSELEDWVLSHIEGILRSGNQEAIAMIDRIDALIIEISEEIVSEKELFNTISGLISESETVRLDIAIDNIPDVYFGTMSLTTNDSPTVLPLDLDFSLRFV
ncbi:MAG: hypothetical protein JXR49_12335 [Acidobacteria bacterium]|nr:hypothetical protein [Acidobacteriota bacterium]